MKSPIWSAESIAKLSKIELQGLLANAKRLNNLVVAAICEAEIVSRAPTPVIKTPKGDGQRNGDFVSGYHFKCSGRRGVIDNNDGTFWTGSWVVARHNVEESMKFGAYVALHENKNELSYLQGEIIEYRLRERDMVDKENLGIEFHCQETFKPLMWAGGGSGEKGYLWRSISSIKRT